MSFFFQFFRKNLCCQARIWSKRRSSLNYITVQAKKVKRLPLFFQFFSKISALMLIVCQKTSILSKTLALHIIFTIFLSKTPALMPIFAQKYVNSINTTLHYGAKNSISRKKTMLSCPSLVNKLPFSKKDATPIPIFCQKNVHSHKNVVISCHFFQT